MKMRLRATIRGQFLALMLMPVLFLVIGFTIAMRLWSHTVDVTAKSQHETAVFISAQTLLEELLDAETGARGYIATGKPVYLEPYASALVAIPASERRLSALVAQHLGQARRVRTIEKLSAREVAVLGGAVRAVRLRRGRDPSNELGLALGKRTMDALRREIGELETEVQRDTVATLAQAERASLWTRDTLVLCVLLGLGIAAGATWQMRRAIERRMDVLVLKARRLADGEDLGAPLSGSDEIADLDRAFHHMAGLLAERTGDLERYRLLAERAQDLMVFTRQRDGQVLHANAAALAAYGYSLPGMRTLHLEELHSEPIPATIAEQLAASSFVSVGYEAEQRRSDGSSFPGEVTVEGRLISGENLQLSIVRDITERRRAQALVADALAAAHQAARAKAEFLATMSHEIRTPMNAVIGMTELILKTSLSGEQRQALEVVSESGTSLLRIIDDILDFSKMEAGKLNVEIVEFPFAKTVESVALTLASQARRRRLRLAVFADPGVPATLYGDAGRIRQVLTNLVGNALKFTPAGTVTLCAEAGATTKEWCDVRFSVTDTGIGIATEDLTRILQPFAQADASTTRLYGGSGLGLSICARLIELMGGSLQVQSTLGNGSTFSFVLRLPAGEAGSLAVGANLRALVVEAQSDHVSEITRYLRAWGVVVQVVPSAAAALVSFAAAAVTQQTFHLVIVDANAGDLAAFLSGSPLAGNSLFIAARRVLVSAGEAEIAPRQVVQAGFSAFLMRPLTQSLLYDCVMNVAAVAAAPIVVPNERVDLRILLAEDNIVNQRVAVQQLRKLGYEATVVATGSAALEAVIAKPYDVILMDCFMPEMDGFTATGAIRRHQGRTGEHTSIIAMTANAQAGDRDACLAAGMDDYLSKPVTLAALRDMLRQYRHVSEPAGISPIS